MDKKKIQRVKSITDYFKTRELPKPHHPLIAVVDFEEITYTLEKYQKQWVFDFYSIALKRNFGSKFKYGQQQYDFDEGILFFMAPGQVFSVEIEDEKTFHPKGYMILLHPDLLWNTPLATAIKHYGFFDYAVNEALFLSDKEEKIIHEITRNIQQECQSNIDKFSKQIIISHIETLLNYSERFYNRQFITREKNNHQMLERLEKIFADYFNNDYLILKGLPTVQYIASKLNVSPSYLSNLLRVLTGQNTQQHIHNKLIEKAKEKLSTTHLSISEIAYELGFEHSQSFSKLFKSKTNVSPMEFRKLFN